VYLFGGRIGYGAGQRFSDDVYAYDVPTNAWTLLRPAGERPPGRQKAGFAYDERRDAFLLYGGHNDSGIADPPPPFSDTWLFDARACAWSRLHPRGSPPAGAVFGRLAYDAGQDAFVLAARGDRGYAAGPGAGYAVQTWMLRAADAGTPTTPTESHGFAGGWADDPSLCGGADGLRLAWAETGTPFAEARIPFHVRVERNVGGAWSGLGDPTAAIGSLSRSESRQPALALIGGTTWAAWYQADGAGESPRLYAARWDGARWDGAAVEPRDAAGALEQRPVFCEADGIAHLAYLRSTRPGARMGLGVRAWDGTRWEPLPDPVTGVIPAVDGAGATPADCVALAGDGASLWIAWTQPGDDADRAPVLRTARRGGSLWSSVLPPSPADASAWATDACIACAGPRVYLAWTERIPPGPATLRVAAWDGDAWAPAAAMLPSGGSAWCYRPSIAASAATGAVYVGWVEQPALGRPPEAHVARVSAGRWSALGGALNADPAGSAHRISVAVVDGSAVAAWGEARPGDMRRIVVKRWNGSTWDALR
jgi:hypothetical protein